MSLFAHGGLVRGLSLVGLGALLLGSAAEQEGCAAQQDHRAAPGPQIHTEITFFLFVGSAVLDLVAARRIYAKAKEMGIVLKVEM